MNRSRVGRGMVAAIGASAALLLTAGTAQAEDIEAITDEYLFEISLDEFMALSAEQPNPDQLDWSTDKCSWSPDEPLGYEFSEPCTRHDFGYRNYKKQDRFNDDSRLQIDDNFKADMYDQCGGDGGCESAADVYYWAVRTFGDMSASTAEAVEKAHITKSTTATGEVLEYRAVDPSGETVEFRVN